MTASTPPLSAADAARGLQPVLVLQIFLVFSADRLTWIAITLAPRFMKAQAAPGSAATGDQNVEVRCVFPVRPEDPMGPDGIEVIPMAFGPRLEVCDRRRVLQRSYWRETPSAQGSRSLRRCLPRGGCNGRDQLTAPVAFPTFRVIVRLNRSRPGGFADLRQFSASPSRTRTDTGRILSPLPLPIGLWGLGGKSSTRALNPGHRIPLEISEICKMRCDRASVRIRAHVS